MTCSEKDVGDERRRARRLNRDEVMLADTNIVRNLCVDDNAMQGWMRSSLL